jgi:hypothetical protein
MRKNDADAAEAKTSRRACSRRRPRMPAGDRADDEEPSELRVGVARGDSAVAEASPDPLHDPHPVAPEEPQQNESRGEVSRDEEGDEVRVVLVDVPAEELRQDDAVAEARDREELRDALDQPEDDGLAVGDER